MFIHTPHVFSKRSEGKCLHLRNASIHSNSSTCSTASFASTTPSSTMSAGNSPTHSTFAASIRCGPPSSPRSAHPDSAPLDFDPLSLHPTYGPPPPRLSERPILQQVPRWPLPPTAQQQQVPIIKAPTPVSKNDEWKTQLAHMLEMSVANLGNDYTPRHTIHTSTPAKAAEVPTDYFMFKMPVIPVRPELKSHWSESTVGSSDEEEDNDEYEDEDSNIDELQESQTSTPDIANETPTPPGTQILIETLQEAEAAGDVEACEHAVKEPHREDEGWPLVRQIPLSRVDSFKRSTITIPVSAETTTQEAHPRRPRIKTINSVENFVKRGGWKRRGIVFDQSEARAAVAAFVNEAAN